MEMRRLLLGQPFVAVMVIGMSLRVFWALFVPVVPLSDSFAYYTLAKSIWQFGVYGWTPEEPTAFWAVGPSAMTAATFLIFGETFTGVVILNLLAGLAILLFTRALATHYFGERVAFWSVVLVAFWPNLIFFTSILSSELHFIALTMGGLYFWSRSSGRAWVNVLLSGFVWGLACYFRPVIVLFPVAMAIAALSQGPRAVGAATLKAGIAIGLIVLIVSPWTLRNAEVIGKAYLVSSNFGSNLWMGNNPESTGEYTPLPPETMQMSEVEREDYLGQLAKDYIREDPGRFIVAVGKRILILHGRETIGVAWNESVLQSYLGEPGVFAAKLVATAYWVMLVLAALAGLAVYFRQVGLAALFHPVFGGWAYFTTVHAIIVSGDRYHMPSAPFVVMLAGLSFAWAIQFYLDSVESRK